MGSIHDGHRERQRQKFREHGLDSFTDVEAIEFLLYYVFRQGNTNEKAHALLDRFQSFRGVFEADPAEIAAVKGLGEASGTLIALVTALNRRYLSADRMLGVTLDSSEAAGEYLKPLFAYLDEEMAILLCLDSASRVLSRHVLGRGTPGSVNLSPRDVVELSLRSNAVRVILAHNHVSGTALPSDADKYTTAALYHALKVIGITLTDHLIFCDNDFVSLRDSGFFNRL